MKTVTKLEAQAPAVKPRKRVAAYARVSRETERLQHSLSAQISYYNDMIQKNPDWIFAGVYVDMKTPSLIQFNDLRRLAGRGG